MKKKKRSLSSSCKTKHIYIYICCPNYRPYQFFKAYIISEEKKKKKTQQTFPFIAHSHNQQNNERGHQIPIPNFSRKNPTSTTLLDNIKKNPASITN